MRHLRSRHPLEGSPKAASSNNESVRLDHPIYLCVGSGRAKLYVKVSSWPLFACSAPRRSRLLCLFCSIRLTGLAADDSFIHRRIALHLLQSGRADFNLNEHVMVTSSPLWTILLAVTGVGLHATYSTPVMEVILVLLGATAAFVLVCELASSESDFAQPRGQPSFWPRCASSSWFWVSFHRSSIRWRRRVPSAWSSGARLVCCAIVPGACR